MPYRIKEGRAVIQFMSSSRMPSLIRKASRKVGAPSGTVYLQHVVAHALSRDLDIPLDQLLAELPPTYAGRDGYGRPSNIPPPPRK